MSQTHVATLVGLFGMQPCIYLGRVCITIEHQPGVCIDLGVAEHVSARERWHFPQLDAGWTRVDIGFCSLYMV